MADHASQSALHASAQAACDQWQRQALANLDPYLACWPTHEPIPEPYALQVSPGPSTACHDALPAGSLAQRPRRFPDDPAAVQRQRRCPYTPAQDVGPGFPLQLLAVRACYASAAHVPEFRLAMAHALAELVRCPCDIFYDRR